MQNLVALRKMEKNFIFLLTLFFGFLEPNFCANNDPVYVNTTRGQVKGFHVDSGNDTTQIMYGQGDIFAGIPFALPPIGNLRFKYPRPLVQFPGASPYDATYYRAACLQPNSNTSSEDCLYVNFFTPNAASTTKYPVMVWIHGGGLIGGSSHIGTTNIIRNFITKDVVVASLDYRMSWLGFFTTFTDDFPPNVGMIDQVMALKFIKEEVIYFGGDPNKITIFGESAGGHSVSSLTYSPLSQNLFQQYIAESGTILTCYEDSVGPTDRSIKMAEYACNYTQDMWNSGNFTALKDCLMNISPDDGLKASERTGGTGNWVCWDMVQDNYFLPGSPEILGPKRPNIPAIIGVCRDEYAAWQMGTVKSDMTYYTRQNVENRLYQQYTPWYGNHSANAASVIKIWEDNYLPPGTADDDHFAWLQLAVDVGTPAYFTWGALRDVEYYLNNNNPNVYAYEFAWSSTLNNDGNPLPNWAPVPHGCEINFVFNYGNWSETDKAVGNLVQEVWTTFAKTGKPSTDNSFTPTTSKNFTALEYFEFNQNSTMKTGFRYKDEIVWNQAIPKVLGNYPPNLQDNKPLCTRGYQSKVKNSTCYEAFGTPATWNDAQTACGTNSYGALVTINSAFENSDVLAYAQKQFPSCTGFYTGLFRSQYTPDWVWVNYDPSTYRNWKSGSPTQTPSCAVLNPNDGTWTNQACTMPQCYICSY